MDCLNERCNYSSFHFDNLHFGRSTIGISIYCKNLLFERRITNASNHRCNSCVTLKASKNDISILFLPGLLTNLCFNKWLLKPQIYSVDTNFAWCRKLYWENIYYSRDIKIKTFEGNSEMIFMGYIETIIILTNSKNIVHL